MSISITEGNRRLLVLADFLEKLPRKRFDYSVWVDAYTWEGKPDLSCGTTACALGWATTIPEFRRRGLRLYRYSLDCGCCYDAGVSFRGERDAIGAACRLFGLIENDAFMLFSPDSSDDALPGNSTPKRVAKHIRRFVANRSGKAG